MSAFTPERTLIGGSRDYRRFGQTHVIHTNNARSLPCSRSPRGTRLKAILS
jgi:hypothetical protein